MGMFGFGGASAKPLGKAFTPGNITFSTTAAVTDVIPKLFVGMSGVTFPASYPKGGVTLTKKVGMENRPIVIKYEIAEPYVNYEVSGSAVDALGEEGILMLIANAKTLPGVEVFRIDATSTPIKQGGGYRRKRSGSRASRKSGRKSRKSKRRSSKKRSSRRSRN